ncbi:holliday junction resolvase Hjc, partial [mine drainage metagenome]
SSGKNQEQAIKLSNMCEKAGLFLIYAFRLKNAKDDPWRIFSTPGEPKGRFRSLYSIIPNLKITKNIIL